MSYQELTLKACSYDDAKDALGGAKLGECCDFSMDAGVKILVFSTNEQADRFAKAMGMEITQ